MSLRQVLAAVLLCGWTLPLAAQDVASGPETGAKVPALKVHDATGMNKDKEVDYAALRKDKTTVYLFVAADKFDRPMNRFMKTLDGKLRDEFEGSYAVAVWLTEDQDKTKEFLPRVQASVNYDTTALTYVSGKDGPKDWQINSDAHLTVIVANKGKVAARFGYRSVNETDVKAVVAALKKAQGK